MNRRRFWAYSCFSPSTNLYVEMVDGDCSDGMPRRETSLLATVHRCYHFYATILQPGEDTFLPGFGTEAEAMTAVLNFLSHASISTPQNA
jgi:hypothetical protein